MHKNETINGQKHGQVGDNKEKDEQQQDELYYLDLGITSKI